MRKETGKWRAVVSVGIVVLIASAAFLAGCRDQVPPGEGDKGGGKSGNGSGGGGDKATTNPRDLVYGYVTPGPDTWYKKDVEGFQYAAKRVGVKVVVLNSNYNVEKEIANIKSLILQGVDGMCVFTFNEGGARIAARECDKARIPLVVTDNAGQVLKQDKDVVACIDFDWKAMGNDWAEYIAMNYPGENIAMVTGLFEHVPVQMYRSTFEPRVKALGKNKIVAIRDGKYNPIKAVEQARGLIDSGVKFSVLFVGNEDMAAAVIRMLKIRKLLNNPIKVISENGSPVGIPLVKDGSLKYTISSSPGWEGMISFLALHEHIMGKSKKLNQQIMLPITPVTKATIDDKTKVVPWEVDPIWLDLTRKYFPQFDGLY